MNNERYPIGNFKMPNSCTPEETQQHIQDIKLLPKKLSDALKNCDIKDLEKTYRDGGWTVAQVVHHCADSHIHAYIRVKFALVEDNFTAKLYEENAWVSTPENKIINTLSSIELIKHLHFRWTELLLELSPEQWQRTFYNPFSHQHINIQQHTALYSWHCRHHFAHVLNALQQS